MGLEMEFSGLCGFVPIPGDRGLQKAVWVLLVNAMDPGQIPGGPFDDENNSIIRPHYPFLRFSLRNIDSTAAPDAFGLWSLIGCDLEIENMTGGVALEPVIPGYPPFPRDSREERSFSWIPRLRMPHTQVFAWCISEDMHAVPEFVTARVRLLSGVLGTRAVVRKRSAPYDPVPFVFDDGTELPARALAEFVLLTVDASRITLRRTVRRTGEISRLVLAGEKIEVAVLNLELENALPSTAAPRIEKRIEEFRWFYVLSGDDRPTGYPRPPYPVPVMPDQLGGNPYCPVAALSP